MAAESGADVYHGALRCLLGLFDAAAGMAGWSEFETEAERLSIKVRGISREDLTILIEGSTTEHRRLHKKASDFARWGRRGGDAPPSP
jgi:hypothetical protein